MTDTADYDDALFTREMVQHRGLHEYVRRFWHVADPGCQFLDNWHIGAVCEFLTDVIVRRNTKRAVIELPPRTGKSIIISALAPAYMWTLEPKHRFMAASYDLNLVEREGQRIIDVVRDPIHAAAWPGTRLRGTVQALKRIHTTAGGRRVGTTPKAAGGTGFGAFTQIVDDPIKEKDSRSKPELELVGRWFKRTMANRIDGDPADFVRLVTMQRLAELDLAGLCREMGYTVLSLPMGDRNPKGEWSNLLWVEQWPPELIKALAKELGPEATASQLLLNPQPDTGSFIERPWVRRFDKLPTAARFMRWGQVWDLNLKGNKSSQSRVAGILFGVWEGDLYITDAYAGHINYPQTRDKMVELNIGEKWGRSGQIWIEDAANGPALMADLKDGKAFAPEMVRAALEISRKFKALPTGRQSKEERVKVQAPKVSAGRLYVHKSLDAVVDEYVGFPNAKWDDLADVITHALSVTLDFAVTLSSKSELLKKILARRR